jgi:hypothetical protein
MARLTRCCAVAVLGSLLVTAIPAVTRAAPPRRRFPPATQQMVPAPSNQPGPARIPLQQPNSFNSFTFSPTFRSYQIPSLPSWVNPAFQVAPGLTVGQAAYNTAVLGRALSFVPPYALGYNPYTSSLYSPYMGYGMGYGGYSPMPYAMSYGRSSGYGGSPSMGYSSPGISGGAVTQPSSYPSSTLRTVPGYGDETDRMPPAAGKAGVLAVLLNEGNGQLDWPQALRILPPALEAAKIREDIDGLVRQAVADTEATGKPDAGVVKRLKQEVRALHELYADRKDLLPVSETVAQAGSAYLRQLEDAIKDMQ